MTVVIVTVVTVTVVMFVTVVIVTVSTVAAGPVVIVTYFSKNNLTPRQFSSTCSCTELPVSSKRA